jgi:Amt family ammonium transporter
VAVTPAAGASGPIGAMILGMLASLVCYGFVGSLKNRLRLDDSLDVFGIHGLGGITGSIGTAIVALPALGGHGGPDYALAHQLAAQAAAVAVAIVWSAVGSAICFGAAKALVPLRHARDAEREGLDIADHGERAYNY